MSDDVHIPSLCVLCTLQSLFCFPVCCFAAQVTAEHYIRTAGLCTCHPLCLLLSNLALILSCCLCSLCLGPGYHTICDTSLPSDRCAWHCRTRPMPQSLSRQRRFSTAAHTPGRSPRSLTACQAATFGTTTVTVLALAVRCAAAEGTLHAPPALHPSSEAPGWGGAGGGLGPSGVFLKGLCSAGQQDAVGKHSWGCVREI